VKNRRFLLVGSDFEPFCMALYGQGGIHIPKICADGGVRFAHPVEGELPDLSLIRTILPLKKYLFPPKDKVLSYSQDNGYQPVEYNSGKLLIFGVHPCDLAAISYLDKIFLNGEPDAFYLPRRKSLALIGVSCMPDKYCSCGDIASPMPADCDIFLYKIETGYMVSCESDEGSAILSPLSPFLHETDILPPESTRDNFSLNSVEKFPDDLSGVSSELQEMARSCLGCGACSICCPTCYCFDLLELPSLNGERAERFRIWDNCLYQSHAEVAGGYNFRKARTERFDYRYRHKYLGFGQLQGIMSCVGCGRCIANCPAGLDLRPLACKALKESSHAATSP